MANLDDGAEGGRQTDRRLGHYSVLDQMPHLHVPASAAPLKWTAPWPSAPSGSHWGHFVATGHAQVVKWSSGQFCLGSCTTAYLAARPLRRSFPALQGAAVPGMSCPPELLLPGE
ncbi:hypothetical protein E5D57_004363 [Metarhizium anisopliae]|nr:hypothetical protein E5D57_004363 [Metarhizium anisopliae]